MCKRETFSTYVAGKAKSLNFDFDNAAHNEVLATVS
jgi:hypothetical protein